MLPCRAHGHSGGMQPATQSARPPRVFVVEDSALIRDRLEAMIALAGAEMVGQASRADAAIRGILDTHPGLVILDVQLEDSSGFDVLRAIRDQAPSIDIYLFSNYDAYPYRELAGRLGARGFFDKSREFDSMRDVVVQRVAASH